MQNLQSRETSTPKLCEGSLESSLGIGKAQKFLRTPSDLIGNSHLRTRHSTRRTKPMPRLGPVCDSGWAIKAPTIRPWYLQTTCSEGTARRVCTTGFAVKM